MRHPTARTAIARGDRRPEVEAHLDECLACAAFAAEVDRIVATAPELGRRLGDPPADLADRVVTAVRSGSAGATGTGATGTGAAGAAGVAGAGLASSSSGREPIEPFVATAHDAGVVAHVRRPVTIALSVAAAALLLVGTVAAVSGAGRTSSSSFETRLAAAATAIEALDTYRFSVDGRAEVVVRLPEIETPTFTPPPIPTPPAIEPPQLQVPDFPAIDPNLPPETRQQMEEHQARLRAQLEAAQRGPGSLDPPTFEPPALPRLELPDEISTTLTFTGDGEVVRPDRLHFAGTVASEHRAIEASTHQGSTELTVVGDRAWVRTDGGRWVASPVPAMGPFGPVLFDTDALGASLRAAAATEDLGEEQLDGTTVRHLRFRVGAAELTGASVPATGGTTYTVDVWIDGEDRVRQARYALEGGSPGGPDARPGMSFTTTATIRLYDFGAALTVEPPPADQVDAAASPGDGLLLVAYPFHLHVQVGLSAALPGLPAMPGLGGMTGTASPPTGPGGSSFGAVLDSVFGAGLDLGFEVSVEADAELDAGAES